MNIKEYIKQAHQNAINKGWHEEKRTFGELIALCHSELSEALEEHRNGRPEAQIHYVDKGQVKPCQPDGIPIELADVVIRIFDMCGLYGIDLEEALRIKMEYNTTREKKHGGKVI